MQSSTIANTAPKNAPAPLRKGDELRNRLDGADEVNQPTAVAFDVLLSAMSQSQARFNNVQDIQSSESMFESPSEQGVANRSAGSDSSSLSSSDLRRDARLDRTSLDSRLADGESKSQGSQASTSSSRDATSSDFASRSLNSQGRLSAERFSVTAERKTQAGYASRRSVTATSVGSTKGDPSVIQPPRNNPDSVAVTASVGKASPTSSSPLTNAAQQVAKILATGPSQASTTNKLATGPGTPPLARETANARQAKGQATDRPANYEDVVKTLNTRRPGAAAFEQLVQSIRMRSIGGKSSANLQLNPPELGRIVVNVEMDGDDVRINVHTENSEARDLLLDRVANLREALQDVGIRVDQFQVDADVDSLPDQQVGSQDARPQDGNATTRDRDAAFNKRASGMPSHRMVDAVQSPTEVGSVVDVAGIIDVKI